MYAKRALARGDDPEEVIRRLADFRSSEKSNPEYYARLTVTKAQATLQPKKDIRHTSLARIKGRYSENLFPFQDQNP